MPNWCDNRVFLRNKDKTKIDALETEMQRKDENGESICEPFQYLRPRPEHDDEDWYNWNVNNWGTKWDASMIDWQREDDNTISLYFESAWSPPTALYDFLTEEGWEVDAVYHEGGMGYIGQFVDGIDEYFEYDITDLETIECLPEELIEFGALRENHEYWKEENEDAI